MFDTKEELSDYIISKVHCDSSCLISNICPEAANGLKQHDCIIKSNYAKLFESFYNLAFCGSDGIGKEVIRVLLQESKNATGGTSEARQLYLTSLIKARGAIYCKEMSNQEKDIDEVSVVISRLEDKLEEEERSKGV